MSVDSKREYPDDENGDVLRSMELDGVDLESSRAVDFEHCFPDEASARQFHSAVSADSNELTLFEPEDKASGEWEVQCKVRMIPTHVAITEHEERFAKLAASFGGYADGWGSLSNPDGSPAE